jgi:hypothetical protein
MTPMVHEIKKVMACWTFNAENIIYLCCTSPFRTEYILVRYKNDRISKSISFDGQYFKSRTDLFRISLFPRKYTRKFDFKSIWCYNIKRNYFLEGKKSCFDKTIVLLFKHKLPTKFQMKYMYSIEELDQCCWKLQKAYSAKKCENDFTRTKKRVAFFNRA